MSRMEGAARGFRTDEGDVDVRDVVALDDK